MNNTYKTCSIDGFGSVVLYWRLESKLACRRLGKGNAQVLGDVVKAWCGMPAHRAAASVDRLAYLPLSASRA